MAKTKKMAQNAKNNEDLDDLDLFFELGVPPSQKKKTATKYLAIQPDAPPILDYPIETTYIGTFFDTYVDAKKQPWDSNKCLHQNCTYKHKYPYFVRQHYLKHFPTEEYVKFKCEICYNNFGSHRGLLAHEGLGKCVIRSDFPPFRYFVNKVMPKYPQQPLISHECSNCQHTFKKVNDCLHHFMSCVREPIHCLKCNAGYVSYNAARIHYEACTAKEESKKKAFFQLDQVKPPASELKEKQWTDADMVKHMRENAVDKMEKIFARYPKPAYGIIGISKNIRNRFRKYRNYPEVYEQSEGKPFVNQEEHLLFKCWRRLDALQYEYLLQRHTILEDGIFFDRFGARMNDQAVRKPVKSKVDELQPQFVYFRVSRVPFTLRNEYEISDDDEFYDSDEEMQPTPSKRSRTEPSTAAGPSTSSSTTKIQQTPSSSTASKIVTSQATTAALFKFIASSSSDKSQVVATPLINKVGAQSSSPPITRVSPEEIFSSDSDDDDCMQYAQRFF